MVTTTIIVINVLIFLYSQTHPEFVERFIFSETRVHRYKQYYRLLTSGFLHNDILHLVFNMYALYSFGVYLEEGTSAGLFLVTFFGSIIAGSLFSLYLHWGEWDYRSLGASGGVSGIIFACVILFDSSVGIPFIPVPIPGSLFVILFFFFSFLFGRNKNSRIGHDAHVGGAIIGCLMVGGLYGMTLELKSILLVIFASLAVIIWIWHEKGMKHMLVSAFIFLGILLGFNWYYSWSMRDITLFSGNPAKIYYQNAKITDEEKSIFIKEIPDESFLLFLKYSLSIEEKEKIKIIIDFKTLSQEQINELKKVFYQEAKEFVDIKGENKEINTLIGRTSSEWSEIVLCIKENKLPNCK